jgi:hypothetical protein
VGNFPLLSFDVAVYVAGAGVCYVEGQKFLIGKDISIAMKSSSSQKSVLDICRVSCEVETHVDNPRYILNCHHLSWVVCDP